MAREDLKVVRYERPPYSKKHRKCKECGKSLSMYNLNKYCFTHSLRGVKVDQQEKLEKIQKAAKKQQEKRKNDTKRRHRDNGARPV